MGRTFMTIARGALPLRGWTHETSPTGICSKAAFVWRVCVINVPLLRLDLEPSASCAGIRNVCMYVCMTLNMTEVNPHTQDDINKGIMVDMLRPERKSLR